LFFAWHHLWTAPRFEIFLKSLSSEIFRNNSIIVRIACITREFHCIYSIIPIHALIPNIILIYSSSMPNIIFENGNFYRFYFWELLFYFKYFLSFRMLLRILTRCFRYWDFLFYFWNYSGHDFFHSKIPSLSIFISIDLSFFLLLWCLCFYLHWYYCWKIGARNENIWFFRVWIDAFRIIGQFR